MGDSEGTLYDFAGFIPGSGQSGVCQNVGIFGAPVRVLSFKPRNGVSREDFEAEWDKAVSKANTSCQRMLHLAILHNCHSHVATALNCVKPAALVPRWLHWNVVTIFLAQLFCAHWI